MEICGQILLGLKSFISKKFGLPSIYQFVRNSMIICQAQQHLRFEERLQELRLPHQLKNLRGEWTNAIHNRVLQLANGQHFKRRNGFFSRPF